MYRPLPAAATAESLPQNWRAARKTSSMQKKRACEYKSTIIALRLRKAQFVYGVVGDAGYIFLLLYLVSV
ncbi:hypothetical protein ANANG_G00134000 [Anguilla anguilla]|uniref:Uncharacterized protein n=1 Tax=Anguilla anguilla TaxID=7936 RepID=A0A9D3MFP0_ANGAN|nr:hypothetical protein ANANG_G00134000 [Anguilla anguilla]